MNNKPKTVKKPWGKEIIFADTKKYIGKILVIHKGRRLSRQYHRRKQETLFCVKGICKIELKDKIVTLKRNCCYELKAGIEHRICAPYGVVELCEVSTPHMSDVVRLEDDYGRSEKNK